MWCVGEGGTHSCFSNSHLFAIFSIFFLKMPMKFKRKLRNFINDVCYCICKEFELDDRSETGWLNRHSISQMTLLPHLILVNISSLPSLEDLVWQCLYVTLHLCLCALFLQVQSFCPEVTLDQLPILGWASEDTEVYRILKFWIPRVCVSF